jgi:hypothetical protein
MATNLSITVLVSELLGSLKIHPQGSRLAAQQASFNFVQRRLGGFGGKAKSSRAKAGARRDN